MSVSYAVPILMGLCLGAGLWTLLVPVGSGPRRRFTQRILAQMQAVDPAVRHAEHQRARAQRGAAGLLLSLVGPLAAGWERRARTGDADQLRRRLDQEGAGRSPADYRTEQVLAAAAGLLIGTVWGIAALLRMGAPGVVVVLAALAGAVTGVWLRGWWLQHRIASRAQRMIAEFPAVAELLALSVGAGESTLGALERVSRVADGVLAEQFRAVLVRTRAGTPLAEALQEMSDRVGVAHLSRFVDGIVVALERGTPLAEVLRAQAQDVRDEDKRELMEAAGRKEIAMMVPLVFLVLPLSVVFAVFPGLALLDLRL